MNWLARLLRPAAAPPARLISQAAFDLIVAEEVTSKSAYEKRYRRPMWPGGQSGVTVGIGYDIGAGTDSAKQLHADWSGHIPEHMIVALESAIDVTGSRAHALAARLAAEVDIPWSAALAVFERVTLPRYFKRTADALPNFEELSLDSKGALVSLVYNRGASFAIARKPSDELDRYREMRAIKAHMASRQFARIPFEIRSMTRLWVGKGLPGLLARREREAKLFEQGLTRS